jgi:hypothetical protein
LKHLRNSCAHSSSRKQKKCHLGMCQQKNAN